MAQHGAFTAGFGKLGMIPRWRSQVGFLDSLAVKISANVNHVLLHGSLFL